MRVKFFLGTTNNPAELNVLLKMSEGIRTWAAANDQELVHTADVQLIGRWQSIVDSSKTVVEFDYDEAYTPCDVAVMFGSWKPREKGHHVIRTAVAQNSRCFVCFETPLLNRSTSKPNTHWRVGVNGFLRDQAFWPAVADPAVADRKLQGWNIQWPGWQSTSDGHIVVTLQLPGDASLRGANINDWAFNVVQDLRQHTQRRIVVRNHPLASMRAFGDHEELARRILLSGIDNIRFSDGALVPWAEDLAGAYCTVTYSSGLAVDSVVSGIPTLAMNPGNFAWPISSNFIEEINQIRMCEPPVVQQWLRELSLCQYSLEDLQNGQCWQNLYPIISNLCV